MPRGSNSSSVGHNRNVKEKNRRLQMKHLLAALASSIPTLPIEKPIKDILDQAKTYLSMLKERVEGLKSRRDALKIENSLSNGSTSKPEIDIRSSDSNVEVILITSQIEKSFMLHDVICILEQEGAEVVNLTYQTVDGRIFCTINSKALSSRIGIDTSRVHERLMNMVYPALN